MKIIDPDSWSYKLGEKIGGILVFTALAVGAAWVIYKLFGGQ